MNICYKTNPNDYAKVYRYNKGGDMKLSNAQRLLGVDLTLEKVFEAYNKIPKKMAFLEKIGIEHKTVSRWRLGINEPLYHKFADFYEYIKEELENESY